MSENRRRVAALVLHGKIGGFDRGMGGARSIDASSVAGLDLAVLCYANFVRHVLEPNRHAGLEMHVLAHSWSPEIGDALDALFKPRLSLHEPEANDRNRRVCDHIETRLHQTVPEFRGFFSGPGWGLNACQRTASHLAGISRALALKRQAERRDGIVYTHVILSRWDVLWNRPVLLAALPVAANVVVVPHSCTEASPLDKQAGASATAAWASHRAHVCHGRGRHAEREVASEALTTTAAVECDPGSRGCSHDLTSAARGVFVLDWWLVASSAAASAFAAIGEAAHYVNMTVAAAHTLHRHAVQRQVVMGHMYWGEHVLRHMGATFRFALHLGVDFTLGRQWLPTRCLGLHPTCGAGGRCDDVSGVLKRPWQGKLTSSLAQRPAPTVYSDGAGLRAACPDGYFFCERGSTMCDEVQRAADPIDRAQARAMYVSCSESFCRNLLQPAAASAATSSSAAPSPQASAIATSSTNANASSSPAHRSPACAGALLALWLAVRTEAPAANASLATELAEAVAAASEGVLVSRSAPRAPTAGEGSSTIASSVRGALALTGGGVTPGSAAAGAIGAEAISAAVSGAAVSPGHSRRAIGAITRRAHELLVGSTLPVVPHGAMLGEPPTVDLSGGAGPLPQPTAALAPTSSSVSKAATHAHKGKAAQSTPRTRQPSSLPAHETLQAACPHWQLAASQGPSRIKVGYCATTDDNPGDCGSGDKGSRKMGPGTAIPDVAACIAVCQRCERCRYVSASPSHRDCSWFHSCRGFERRSMLGTDFGGESYLTVQVKH